jgi:HSP20 family protein
MAEKAKETEGKSLAARRPFSDLARWERDMERMFDDFVGRRMRPWWPERFSMPAGIEITPPAVDLFEEKDDIVVKAELPGMDKDNIQVNLTDQSLTIRGEKKKEEEVKEENYYRSEVPTALLCGRWSSPPRLSQTRSRRASKTECWKFACRRPNRQRPKRSKSM